MIELTPSERRGALVFVLLLALGAGWDLWRARHPDLTPLPAPAAAPGAAAPAPGVPAAPSRSRAAQPATVDLNRAGPEELDALPGIGPVLARRIVAHRAVHGPFTRPEDLLAVRGIGPRVLARLRPYVVVGPPAAH